MLMPKNIQVFNIYTDINFYGTPCKSVFGDTNNNQANYDEVKTRLCFVVVGVNVVVVVVLVVVMVLIVVAVHKGLVVVNISLSDTH